LARERPRRAVQPWRPDPPRLRSSPSGPAFRGSRAPHRIPSV